MPGFELAFALHVDVPAWLAKEAILYQFVRAPGDLDRVWLPMRLHAAGRIDGISPQVIGKLPVSDDPGYHRSRVDANAHTQPFAFELVRTHMLAHLERQSREHLGMIGSLGRHAGCHHVAI